MPIEGNPGNRSVAERQSNIRRAAEIAIDGGAHFLKTSTGKTQPAATPEAAGVLIEVIAAARHARSIGFKASGGIRKIDDAMVYVSLYESKSVSGSASAENFRIGASGLFKELLTAAGACTAWSNRHV